MTKEYENERVYVTRPGETYHTARDCSTLNCAPYVESVRKSELNGDRSLCKMCSQERTISAGLCVMLEEADPEDVV